MPSLPCPYIHLTLQRLIQHLGQLHVVLLEQMIHLLSNTSRERHLTVMRLHDRKAGHEQGAVSSLVNGSAAGKQRLLSRTRRTLCSSGLLVQWRKNAARSRRQWGITMADVSTVFPLRAITCLQEGHIQTNCEVGARFASRLAGWRKT